MSSLADARKRDRKLARKQSRARKRYRRNKRGSAVRAEAKVALKRLRRARKKIASALKRLLTVDWNGNRPVPKLRRVVRYATRQGLYVTSTVRSPSHNASIGGSPTSFHLPPPRAVDLAGPDMSGVQWALLRKFGASYFEELFGPANWYIKDGAVHTGAFPAHGDHIHAVRRQR